MKYHLSDDGPAICRATIRNCPYGAAGGDHFESLPEAEKAFADSLGGDVSSPLKKPKIYAPAKPEIPTLTKSSVQDILSNLKKIPKHLTTVEGFGYLGSSLYGLHHEDSDQDVFVLGTVKALASIKLVKKWMSELILLMPSTFDSGNQRPKI